MKMVLSRICTFHLEALAVGAIACASGNPNGKRILVFGERNPRRPGTTSPPGWKLWAGFRLLTVFRERGTAAKSPIGLPHRAFQFGRPYGRAVPTHFPPVKLTLKCGRRRTCFHQHQPPCGLRSRKSDPVRTHTNGVNPVDGTIQAPSPGGPSAE